MMNGSNKKLDERQKELIGNSMAIAAVIAYLYEIIIIIYKFSKTQDIKTIYMEIGLIATMFVFMVIYYIVTGEYDSSIEKSKTKRKLFSKLDERQKKRIAGSLGMAAFVATFYSVFLIFFKFIHTRSMESAYTEIALVAIISVTIILYHIINKEYHVPKTLFGRTLPLGSFKKDKMSRLVYYVKDAIGLTIVFLIFDIMAPDRLITPIPLIDSKIFSYTINLFIRFIIFFLINYSWGEYNVKKQNKFNASLEDDE